MLLAYRIFPTAGVEVVMSLVVVAGLLLRVDGETNCITSSVCLSSILPLTLPWAKAASTLTDITNDRMKRFITPLRRTGETKV